MENLNNFEKNVLRNVRHFGNWIKLNSWVKWPIIGFIAYLSFFHPIIALVIGSIFVLFMIMLMNIMRNG